MNAGERWLQPHLPHGERKCQTFLQCHPSSADRPLLRPPCASSRSARPAGPGGGAGRLRGRAVGAEEGQAVLPPGRGLLLRFSAPSPRLRGRAQPPPRPPPGGGGTVARATTRAGSAAAGCRGWAGASARRAPGEAGSAARPRTASETIAGSGRSDPSGAARLQRGRSRGGGRGGVARTGAGRRGRLQLQSFPWGRGHFLLEEGPRSGKSWESHCRGEGAAGSGASAHGRPASLAVPPSGAGGAGQQQGFPGGGSQ